MALVICVILSSVSVFAENTITFVTDRGTAYSRADFGEMPLKRYVTISTNEVREMRAGYTFEKTALNAEIKTDIKEETDGKFPTLRIADAMANKPLSYQPGEKWGYSLGHDLLGAFVELVSGKKFGEYLKENIFEPLGMDSFTFERNG